MIGWAALVLDGLDGPAEVNVGGGMAVDYGAPGHRFDWAAYGAGLEALRRAPASACGSSRAVR